MTSSNPVCKWNLLVTILYFPLVVEARYRVHVRSEVPWRLAGPNLVGHGHKTCLLSSACHFRASQNVCGREYRLICKATEAR